MAHCRAVGSRPPPGGDAPVAAGIPGEWLDGLATPRTPDENLIHVELWQLLI